MIVSKKKGSSMMKPAIRHWCETRARAAIGWRFAKTKKHALIISHNWLMFMRLGFRVLPSSL